MATPFLCNDTHVPIHELKEETDVMELLNRHNFQLRRHNVRPTERAEQMESPMQEARETKKEQKSEYRRGLV